MDRLSLVDQFADLRDISENVTDYLARELYIDSFGVDEDYSPNDILQECYTIVIQELRDLGIIFLMEPEDLLNDWYTAKHIYYLRVLADNSTILSLLKNKENFDKFNSLLQDDMEISDIAASLVEYLAYKNPEDTSYQRLLEFSDYFQSTERFKAHLQAILDKLATQDPTVEMPNVEKATEYIKKIMASRGTVTKAVKNVITGLQLNASLNMKLINKLLYDYDMDKISTDNLKWFSLLDTDGELPARARVLKEKMLREHHERSPHHIEYWLKNKNMHPEREHLILMVAHHYEVNISPSEFWHRINTLTEQGASIFSLEDIQFIESVTKCLIGQRTLGEVV